MSTPASTDRLPAFDASIQAHPPSLMSNLNPEPQDASSASDDEPKPKKRRVNIACDRCRTKKVKCDGRRPVCGHCTRRKHGSDSCSWHYAIARTDQRASRFHIEQLQEQIKELQRRPSEAPKPDSRRGPLNATTAADEVEDTAVRQDEATMQNAHQTSITDSPALPLTYMSTGKSNGLSESLESLEDGRDIAILSVTENDNGLGVYGSSSIGSFMTTVRQAVDRNFGSGRKADLRGSQARISNEPETTPMLGSGVTTDAFLLPQRSRANALIKIYWDRWWPISPIVAQQSLMKQYENLWSGEQNPGDESEFLCVLNAIWALSSLLEAPETVRDNTAAANAFFRRARELMVFWSPASLLKVQGFLLLAQYLQTTNDSHSCWMFVGYAVRTAESLGLHLPETTERMSPISQREEYRRVWLSCIYMDRVLAMVFGRPTVIKHNVATLSEILPLPLDGESLPTDGITELPTVDSPQVIDFSLHSHFLFNILSEILENFYDLHPRPKPTSSDEHKSYFGVGLDHNRSLYILEIDHKLSKWQRSLPIHLQYNQTAIDNCYHENISMRTRILVRQAVVLRQRYLHIRLLSLRPILASFVSLHADHGDRLAHFGTMLARRLAHQCSIVCCKVAQEAVDLVHSNLPSISTPLTMTASWWYNVFYVYAAATVLIAAKLDVSIVSELNEESLNKSWKQALDVLESCKSSSDSIPKLLAALHLLHDKVPTRYSQHTYTSQYVPQADNNGFNLNGAEGSGAENSGMPQFDYSNYESSINAPNSHFQHQREMPGSSIDDPILGQLDAMAFDPSDMSWLNAMPFDF